ncbi:histidine kinase (plasmid) [Nostoc sp. NIES-3756]|uniref:hybrid sensor histidine kinase/response regulator n=1 Tax=Nostoc sp. NIES-3756 TaxID=1751286 RepID=UPI00071F99E9|nr:hybrid sensor histidine kinase/response regulator [Nostoc sp. NIES-3756]BAT56892.1 histidine kinase [Nostoc sp. NIES-3756]
MEFSNKGLTKKIASSFLLLSLLSLGAVAGVTFINAREALKQAAFNRLNVAATLKEEEITRWFEDQQQDFWLTTQFPDIQVKLNTFLSLEKSAPEYESVAGVLSEYFREAAKLKPNFREIYILDRSNRIILSTDRKREGQYELLGNITYVEDVKLGYKLDPIFYVSPVTGKPSVTLATELRDKAGVRQGMILAHVSLDQIDQIVRERTGLSESGETYLVGSLITKNTFISQTPTKNKNFLNGISSKGIDAAMSGSTGSGLYKNYAGVPVIGVYRWLNDQDLALLVEMGQAEAFAPARHLAGITVIVGMVSVGGLLIGVYWLMRQLKLASEKLENYSHQLEVKAQEAEAASRAKSEFLANMSHELRTPLNSILGFTQIMTRDRSISSSGLEHLEIISRSGEHLLTLINDVLSMSKIEAGRTILNQHSFDLYNLLNSLEEMFHLKAESKGLQLIFTYSSEVPQYVRTDESKLRQVLINILGNAIKFTSTGHVTLRVKFENKNKQTLKQKSSDTAYLYFEIEDTGLGIAPDEINQLFKPFVQTKTGNNSQQGTGLGLTISQRFVNLMGGNISVNSRVGKGTILNFKICISLAELFEIPTRKSYKYLIGLEPNQPQYRILIVEDIKENRQLLAKILTPLGFDVREAENGQEGLKIWETWEPHLIWMDMRMPVMDGYEATKKIRATLKGQATVIIALTASAFDEERSLVLSVGCNDFIHKPFQEEVIFDTINKYLGVRYVYAPDVQHVKKLEANSDWESSSLKQALNQMPAEWVTQLHQAALCTDEGLIFSLLKQLPPESVHLTNTLTNWVNNFRIDKIIDLTQSG